MFTSRLLIASVAVWVTALLAPANADSITINLLGTDDEAEQEFSPGHRQDVGNVRKGSSDLELGVEGAGGYSRPLDVFQRVALRYQNIDIPLGAVITDARIQFMADNEPDKTNWLENDPTLGILEILQADLTFYGYLDPDSPANSPALPPVTLCDAFGNCIEEYGLTVITGGIEEPFTGVGSGITNVTLPVHWDDVLTWSTGAPDYAAIAGAAGPDQRSPNLASIVQEIIDLEGWASGNSMTFLVDPKVVGVDPDTGEDIFSNGNRTAIAFNCGPSPNRCVDFPVDPPVPPVLTIDFIFSPSQFAADFDVDGDVDGDDFLAWQAGFGLQGASLADGDADGDGDTDGDDFLVWQAEFGSSTPAAAARVPEPTTAAIMALLCCALATRGRRRAD